MYSAAPHHAAKERAEPDTKIVDVLPTGRRDTVNLVNQSIEEKRQTYVLVNNRSEGKCASDDSGTHPATQGLVKAICLVMGLFQTGSGYNGVDPVVPSFSRSDSRRCKEALSSSEEGDMPRLNRRSSGGPVLPLAPSPATSRRSKAPVGFAGLVPASSDSVVRPCQKGSWALRSHVHPSIGQTSESPILEQGATALKGGSVVQ